MKKKTLNSGLTPAESWGNPIPVGYSKEFYPSKAKLIIMIVIQLKYKTKTKQGDRKPNYP